MKIFCLSSLRLWIGLIAVSFLAGCNFGPLLQSTEKIANSKVVNPSFHIPPLNLKDYKDRHWILLAESKENNWFYDPYSLKEDEDSIVSFDAFIAPRKISPQLDRFNASIKGPYLQKIDCFGNYQWSEIFYADGMPDQETFINPRNPSLVYGWIKIKPKTAMAYIRTRVCGRKFLDDKNVNYFLFQDGRMRLVSSALQSSANPTKPKATARQKPSIPSQEVQGEEVQLTPAELMVKQYTNQALLAEIEAISTTSELSPPLFYEVINNEVNFVDEKSGVREMRVSSFQLNKEFPKLEDYVYRANCQTKIYSFSTLGKTVAFQKLSDAPESLANVAFNRLCGDHGNYMKLVSRKGRQ